MYYKILFLKKYSHNALHQVYLMEIEYIRLSHRSHFWIKYQIYSLVLHLRYRIKSEKANLELIFRYFLD